jgi:hypothetical protein
VRNIVLEWILTKQNAKDKGKNVRAFLLSFFEENFGIFSTILPPLLLHP